MTGNSIGNIFKLTSFGESHGPAVGGIIEGCPAGILLDIEAIQKELNRRKPGQSKISSARAEDDQLEILSGLYEGKTLGSPIGFLVKNKDSQSSDYDELKSVFRPSHADYTYSQKYGIRDHRGGGRSSARETISRVVGGAVAKQILKVLGVDIRAYVSQVGNIICEKKYSELALSDIDSNIVRCPDAEIADKMIHEIMLAKAEGDSLGGVITCIAKNVPVGLGEPVFDKLHAEIGKAVLSIPAVKGIEFGSGFSACAMKGSEHNDIFEIKNGKVHTLTNFSGGIQGGISNGEDIYFRVAFKPVATIFKNQDTINLQNEKVNLSAKGRHDPCVLPRAVPIIEAMTAIVLCDYFLLNQARIKG